MLDNLDLEWYGCTMMKFESDLVADEDVTVIPTGAPDLLDEWYEVEQAIENLARHYPPPF